MTHAETICTEVRATTQYHGKSYSARFACPICGRHCRQNLNWLGRRHVICDGNKFFKQSKEDKCTK